MAVGVAGRRRTYVPQYEAVGRVTATRLQAGSVAAPRFAPKPKKAPARAEAPARVTTPAVPIKIMWPRVAVLLALSAAAFAVGRVSAPDTVPVEQVSALKAQIAESENEIEAVRMAIQVRREAEAAERAEAAQELTIQERIIADTYVVQPGETMAMIALAACGSEDLASYMATFNGIGDPTVISAGTELKIPSDCLPG